MADPYAAADRMDGLARLAFGLRGDDARRVHEAIRRMYFRGGPWRVDGVPTRSQLRDGWYWGDGMTPRGPPRPRPVRPGFD